MIIGTGIDIVEVTRIKAALEKCGGRFATRVFTEAEQAYCTRGGIPAQHYAARFAAKEALVKALGTGFRYGAWRDMEVLPDRYGKPIFTLTGRLADAARRQGVTEIHTSLSHTRTYAIAQLLQNRVVFSMRIATWLMAHGGRQVFADFSLLPFIFSYVPSAAFRQVPH